MQIIKGKIKSAQKVVIYGPEGIGKSTFASKFPDPLFIDTEGSTKKLDVARTEKPSSWTMLLSQIQYIKSTPGICKTLVVDTIDWAEQMCISSICATHQKKGIEEFGYGNGYVYTAEEFGRFLNLLNDVIETGINVVLTAHAQLRKFEQPDEMGSYDRYELKLGKKTSSQTSPLVKEWADMVLFANYKTYSVAVDDKGKKHKVQGGSRVMYTNHHPCWDAKNRDELEPELPFDYSSIAHIFTGETEQAGEELPRDSDVVELTKEEYLRKRKNSTTESLPEEKESFVAKSMNVPDENSTQERPSQVNADMNHANIPKALLDLMKENNVDAWTLETVVSQRGYYPNGTPLANYDPDFINGVLIGAWPQVYKMIQELGGEIPFN